MSVQSNPGTPLSDIAKVAYRNALELSGLYGSGFLVVMRGEETV